MTDDRVQAVFREECGELLAHVEETLLQAEQSQVEADREQIDDLFRSIHTIKGNSSMFGRDALAEFAHRLESLFELIRRGERTLTQEVCSLGLESVDCMKALLDGGDRADAITDRVSTLAKHIDAEVGANRALSPDTDGRDEVKYRIRFQPYSTLFERGIRPHALLEELAKLGRSEVTCREVEPVPPLNALDTSNSYFEFRIELETTAPRREVEDVFIFVGDDALVSIEELSSDEPAESGPGAESEKDDPNGDESLVEVGASASDSTVISGGRTRTIRVDVERLDQLVNLVGEIVTLQARMQQQSTDGSNDRARGGVLRDLVEQMGRQVADLRESAMALRMIPVSDTLDGLARLLRDLTLQCGKMARLRTVGTETEIDKKMSELLKDPLVHILRNAVDHGIEAPAERIELEKPEEATIEIVAEYAGTDVQLRIIDDGRGLDTAAIRDRAIERGLIDSSVEWSEREIHELVFHPGFSTRSSAGALSGRGVGLDVVRKNIEQLGGSVSIASERGKGCELRLRVPLTLAIIDGLMIQVGDEKYVINLGLVDECLRMTADVLDRSASRRLAHIRGTAVPYLSLRSYLEVPGEAPDTEQMVVVRLGEHRAGIVVDAILGQVQAVIKPLDRVCRNIAAVSGSTVTGDGSIALILDVHKIVETADGSAHKTRATSDMNISQGEAV